MPRWDIMYPKNLPPLTPNQHLAGELHPVGPQDLEAVTQVLQFFVGPLTFHEHVVYVYLDIAKRW